MNTIPTAEEFLIRQGCQRMDCELRDKHISDILNSVKI